MKDWCFESTALDKVGTNQNPDQMFIVTLDWWTAELSVPTPSARSSARRSGLAQGTRSDKRCSSSFHACRAAPYLPSEEELPAAPAGVPARDPPHATLSGGGDLPRLLGHGGGDG